MRFFHKLRGTIDITEGPERNSKKSTVAGFEENHLPLPSQCRGNPEPARAMDGRARSGRKPLGDVSNTPKIMPLRPKISQGTLAAVNLLSTAQSELSDLLHEVCGDEIFLGCESILNFVGFCLILISCLFKGFDSIILPGFFRVCGSV